MSNADLTDILIVAGWLILYLVAVTVAAAKAESDRTGVRWRVPAWLAMGFPYAVGVGFAVYFTEPWAEGALVNSLLFAITFVALTWVIVWSVRRQKTES